jgi:hypothetical protein
LHFRSELANARPLLRQDAVDLSPLGRRQLELLTQPFCEAESAARPVAGPQRRPLQGTNPEGPFVRRGGRLLREQPLTENAEQRAEQRHQHEDQDRLRPYTPSPAHQRSSSS